MRSAHAEDVAEAGDAADEVAVGQQDGEEGESPEGVYDREDEGGDEVVPDTGLVPGRVVRGRSVVLESPVVGLRRRTTRPWIGDYR